MEVSPRKFLLFLSTVTVIVVLVLSFLPAFLPSPKRALDLAPPSILDMERRVLLEGEEAIEDVGEKHIGAATVWVEDAVIVEYADATAGKTLKLWISVYPDESIAERQTYKMAIAMIKYGGGWRSNLQVISVEGSDVFVTSPDGMLQFFWHEGRYMFYMTPLGLTYEEIIDVVVELNQFAGP